MCCLLTTFVGPTTLAANALVVVRFIECHQLSKLKITAFSSIVNALFIFSIRHGTSRESVLLLFVD
jgi:hypothetical protein